MLILGIAVLLGVAFAVPVIAIDVAARRWIRQRRARNA